MSIRDREIALACVLCWVGRTRRWAANRFIRIGRPPLGDPV